MQKLKHSIFFALLSTLLMFSSVTAFAQETTSSAASNTSQSILTPAKPDSTVPWEYNVTSTSKLQTSAAGPVIVDISKWQGKIDWAKASENLDLVIIRTQYGIVKEDSQHARNEKYAKKYDVPFGVYSYVQASTPENAKKEARAFYKRASKSTKFYVLDIEEFTNRKGYSMRQIANAYVKELRKQTDKKIGLYVAHHLYSKLNLDKSKFDFVWIPRYSTTKPKYDYDLWQYTDRGRVAGIPGYVDLNRLAPGTKIEYFTNRITKASVKKPTKKYYTKNPTYIRTVKKLTVYKGKNFTKKTETKKKIAANEILKVKKVVKSSKGTPHFQLTNGQYVTALKTSVVAVTKNIKKYYTYDTKPKKIVLTKNTNLYTNKNFTKKTKKIKKNTVLSVKGIAFAENGYPRLKLTNGYYISANKAYSQEVTKKIEQYYVEVPENVVVAQDEAVAAYKTPLFKDAKYKAIYTEGEALKIKKIVYNKKGYPRFLLKNGLYVSTKKVLYEAQ